jgi:hypothetical protein
MTNNDTPPPTYGMRIEFGEAIVSEFETSRRRPDGRLWVKGYTQGELDTAQAKYDLSFPPDLVTLLREKRPVLGYDWRTDEREIREALAWPLEGLLFDVEHNGLWWPAWGDRPTLPQDRAAVLGRVVGRAPRLIPLISHRYLPNEPNEAGNPVFSVYRADIIYYGVDLADYFERELVDPSRPLPIDMKRIRFWSDFVDSTS